MMYILILFLTYVLHLLLKAKLGVYSCGTCFSSCYAAFSPNQRSKISRKRESAFWMYRCILIPCCIRFEGAEDNPCI